MASTAMTPTYEGPHGSGRASRPRDPRHGWRAWLRRKPAVGPCFRFGVFLAGLVLVLAGAALWLFSALLTLPPVLAGLWIWSKEFHWGHRLFHAFLHRARRVWASVRVRPLRWSVLTAVGVASGAGGSWAIGHFHLLHRATHALGL